MFELYCNKHVNCVIGPALVQAIGLCLYLPIYLAIYLYDRKVERCKLCLVFLSLSSFRERKILELPKFGNEGKF